MLGPALVTRMKTWKKHKLLYTILIHEYTIAINKN
jgi:hypothetical protein